MHEGFDYTVYTEDDLHRLLYNFHLVCLTFNMKISIHKTKAMTICKEFNYLGANVTSSGNLVENIKTQAQKAARKFGCLNDLV